MKNYERLCPSCNTKIEYKSYSGWYLGKKKNANCRKCASVKTGFTERYATKGKNTGSENAFHGKHHSDETKKTLSERDVNWVTKEYRKKMSVVTSGDKNPMYGRSFYDVWIEKYGKEEADRRLELKKKNNSIAASGKNNPMYGKPPPTGCGNGWKGWYRGIYFRSLRELMLMLKCDEFKIKFRTAEDISIKYKDYKNADRTYRPDFVIGKSLVEIKPKRLISTPNILAKSSAAIEYCKENNLKYKIIDIPIYCDDIQKNLQNIKFDRDYLERFQKYVQINCSPRVPG